MRQSSWGVSFETGVSNPFGVLTPRMMKVQASPGYVTHAQGNHEHDSRRGPRPSTRHIRSAWARSQASLKHRPQRCSSAGLPEELAQTCCLGPYFLDVPVDVPDDNVLLDCDGVDLSAKSKSPSKIFSCYMRTVNTKRRESPRLYGSDQHVIASRKRMHNA